LHRRALDLRNAGAITLPEAGLPNTWNVKKHDHREYQGVAPLAAAESRVCRHAAVAKAQIKYVFPMPVGPVTSKLRQEKVGGEP
jgi:hypothetical protein